MWDKVPCQLGDEPGPVWVPRSSAGPYLDSFLLVYFAGVLGVSLSLETLKGCDSLLCADEVLEGPFMPLVVHFQTV